MSELNRRQFLKTTAATAAAAGFATATLGGQAPSENLHFALVGAGEQGRRDAENLLRVPGTKLTAICEINPIVVGLAKQLAPDARVYNSWNELIAKERDLQGVIVALPEDTHSAATIAAIEAGLDVFCEKPMAYSLEQSRAMMAARDKHQRVLQIGQQRRSNPLYYLAERLVNQEGAIGEILRIETFWDRWGDWKRPVPELDEDFSRWGYPTPNHLVNWRLFRKYGHGLITENGTHQLDIASWMLEGRLASSVVGMGAIRYHDERETHDICTAEYMFDGGTIVRFAQDFHQGFNYGWSYGELLLGTEGSMRISTEQELVIYDRNRKATKVPISRLGDLEIGGMPALVTDMSAYEADRTQGGLRTYSYENEMRIFANSIRNRTPPSCTGEIGHNAIAFTIAGSEAQYDEKVLPLNREMFV